MSGEGLARDPFGPTADAASYVARPETERVLEDLAGWALQDRPAALLVGPPGIGKTLILRVLERRLEAVCRCVALPYAALPAQELCAWALGLLGEPAPSAGDAEATLVSTAERLARTGRPLLVLVDDASAMPADTARRLRALAEGSGGALRVLAAGLELGVPGEQDPNGPDAWMSAFGRDVPRFRLGAPMTEDETAHYVRARLEGAAVPAATRARFDAGVLERIHRGARGVPRDVHAFAGEFLRLGPRALPPPVAQLERAPSAPAARARAPAIEHTPVRAAEAAPAPTPSAALAPPPTTGGAPAPSAAAAPPTTTATAPVAGPPPSSAAAPAAPTAAPRPGAAAAPTSKGTARPEPPPILLTPPRSAPPPAPKPPESAPPPSARATPPPQPAVSPPVLSPDAPVRADDTPAVREPTPPRVGAPPRPAGEPVRPAATSPPSVSTRSETAAAARPRRAARAAEAPPARRERVSRPPPRTLARGPGRTEIALSVIALAAIAVAVPVLRGRLVGPVDSPPPPAAVRSSPPTSVAQPPTAAPAPEAPATSLPPVASSDTVGGAAAAARSAPGMPSAGIQSGSPTSPAADEHAAGAAIDREPVGGLADIAVPSVPSAPTAAAPSPRSTADVPSAPASAPPPTPAAESRSPAPAEIPAAPKEIALAPAPSASPPAPAAEPAPEPTPTPIEPVRVNINATPWATIQVDGIDLGETPLANVPLVPGPHRFVARMPDGRSVERTVQVDEKNRHIGFE
ncbi:MAG TPA: AAA family ATPase [Myxococcota bacterium]|nr:AAA family ATPase [Myxococcota bacterium]